MTTNENQLLKEVNTKLDLIIGHFNILGDGRMTPKECENVAQKAVLKFKQRNELKSLPKSG